MNTAKHGRRYTSLRRAHADQSRGFPFSREVREHFAALILQYGARGAAEVSEIPVTHSTLLKVAREFDIPLRKGRRRREAA